MPLKAGGTITINSHAIGLMSDERSHFIYLYHQMAK